ncbi:hypothetical protein QE152_g30735 [Popillia japonica]|uniref:Uncharacterized protein n=1 Tax=Popillia japonica TaxID=7064 RepID=A0AAW1JDT1_POPJA
MSEKIDRMERNERQNNVIVTGLRINTQDPNQLRCEIEKNLEKYLGIKFELVSQQEKEKVMENKKRLRQVKGIKMFINHDLTAKERDKKEKVMENKKRLRQVKGIKMFINHDLTAKERDIQNQIRKCAIEERNKGRRVLVKYQKLIVNNEIWIWDKEVDKLILKSPTSKSYTHAKN